MKHQLLHVSGLIGPSSGSTHLYKTIAQQTKQLYYFKNIKEKLSKTNAYINKQLFFYKRVLPDDGSIRAETCRILCFITFL